VAEVMARMKGWEVRAFPKIHVFHHRPTGGEKGSIWARWFSQGVEDYLLGYHFAFVLVRCFLRSMEKPYLLGSLIMLCGYIWHWIRRTKRQVSSEFVQYIRNEQLKRLLFFLYPRS
jgi:poly-beta-1,6-N-acetyl-D-glucosamine synthase